MSTQFPTGIDLFDNPTTLKVDGVDLVRAAHVNDLQDSVAAIENLLITPGTTYDWDATNIPNDTSVVAAIKLLDAVVATDEDALADHIAYVTAVDPAQHHANVITVTAGGNLAATRVQAALEELQADIDDIMSGGTVEGATLDDRYVEKTGSQSMAGPLTITGNLVVNGTTTLGDAISDTTTVAGALTVANGATISAGDLTISAGNVLIDEDNWVGKDEYSGLTFDGDDVYLKSKRHLILRLDADDIVDGNTDAATLTVVNGLGSTILTVEEDATVTLTGDLEGVDGFLETLAISSVSETLTLSETDIIATSSTLRIDLDNGAAGTGEKFVITKNNDPGTNLASTDLLLNVDENAVLTAGVHKLKSGIQESGYFGLRVDAPSPGGQQYGAGVNFKTVLTNAPSSITLTPALSTNVSTLSVVHSNTLGFFFDFLATATGPAVVYGTYTTVGN